MQVIIHPEPVPRQSHDSGEVGSDPFTALCSVLILSIYAYSVFVCAQSWTSVKSAVWGRKESGSQMGGGLSGKERRRTRDSFERFCCMQ